MGDPHALGYAWATVHRCASGTNGGHDAAGCGLASEARPGLYAQRFAENDIDVSVLPYLTDADLENALLKVRPCEVDLL